MADLLPAYDPNSTLTLEEQRAKRQAAMQGDVLMNLSRNNAEASIARDTATEAARKVAAGTMAGDAAAWTTAAPYQTSYAKTPQYVKQHFIDSYGPAAAEAPEAWNQSVRENTGNPLAATGVQSLPGDAQYQVNDKGGVSVEGNPAALIRPDEGLLAAARSEQISTTDDGGRELTRPQLEQRVIEAQKQAGEIPLAKQGVLNRQLSKYTASREYTNGFTAATSLGNFFSAAQQAETNPNAANNLAAIDNFVRIQNPGATVRQGTLAMIKSGQAILQKLTPEYLAGHLEEGQFLTDQYLKDAKKVAMDEAQNQNEAFEKSILAAYTGSLKKSGIPTDDFQSPYKPILDKLGSQEQTDPYADARAWLKSNPNDPRAAQVRDAIARKESTP